MLMKKAEIVGLKSVGGRYGERRARVRRKEMLRELLIAVPGDSWHGNEVATVPSFSLPCDTHLVCCVVLLYLSHVILPPYGQGHLGTRSKGVYFGVPDIAER